MSNGQPQKFRKSNSILSQSSSLLSRQQTSLPWYLPKKYSSNRKLQQPHENESLIDEHPPMQGMDGCQPIVDRRRHRRVHSMRDSSEKLAEEVSRHFPYRKTVHVEVLRGICWFVDTIPHTYHHTHVTDSTFCSTSRFYVTSKLWQVIPLFSIDEIWDCQIFSSSSLCGVWLSVHMLQFLERGDALESTITRDEACAFSYSRIITARRRRYYY